MDCFLLEGPKILFRISLALVHLFTKNTGKKHESNGNIQNITDFCQQIPVSIDRLLHVSNKKMFPCLQNPFGSN
jgi:hypothetical protein